jgi:hypothetical protein
MKQTSKSGYINIAPISSGPGFIKNTKGASAAHDIKANITKHAMNRFLRSK